MVANKLTTAAERQTAHSVPSHEIPVCICATLAQGVTRSVQQGLQTKGISPAQCRASQKLVEFAAKVLTGIVRSQADSAASGGTRCSEFLSVLDSHVL